MFKTVLKNVVCIYRYMGQNKIKSDSDDSVPWIVEAHLAH